LCPRTEHLLRYPSCLLRCRPAPRHPPSFPTRRSSDLLPYALPRAGPLVSGPRAQPRQRRDVDGREVGRRLCSADPHHAVGAAARSEEHTSELQSRFDLVCRLLLEKKKTSSESNN